MNLLIKNIDTEKTIMVVGMEKITLDGSPFMGESTGTPAATKRYVLRPQEEQNFYLKENEILGIEEL